MSKYVTDGAELFFVVCSYTTDRFIDGQYLLHLCMQWVVFTSTNNIVNLFFKFILNFYFKILLIISK